MPFPFTNRELDLMAVLWNLGSASVSEVQERLDDELAYTTVLTTLRNMEEKGYVSHTEEGRAYRYHPRIPREEAGKSAIRRLVGKIFGGSRELLLTHLLSRSAFSDDELKRLQEMVAEQLDGEDAHEEREP
jgi:predicted transcriptional regulator